MKLSFPSTAELMAHLASGDCAHRLGPRGRSSDCSTTHLYRTPQCTEQTIAHQSADRSPKMILQRESVRLPQKLLGCNQPSHRSLWGIDFRRFGTEHTLKLVL